MYKLLALLTSMAIGSASTMSTAYADETISYEGGVVLNLQATNDNRVNSDQFASFDFVTNIQHGMGSWTLYFEANTDIRDDQVSAIIGEANADAGSALDEDGNGRIQVSELFYTLPALDGELSIGMLDATGALDASDVANDEGSQFVGGSFVNNPTIGFPDYSLGFIYTNHSETSGTGFSIVGLSSHGLGDNEHVSYEELFDIGDDHKGIFLAGEYQWQMSNSRWRAGVWTNTADNDHVDGSGKTSNNYGAYLSTDIMMGDNTVNVRAGVANDEVSEADGFIAASIETKWLGDAMGFGIAKTFASDELSGADDTTQAEVYSRFDINDSFQVTPSLQWISNSGFNDNNTAFDDDIIIAGVRLAYSF